MIYRLDENNNLICGYSENYPHFKEDWILIETDLIPNDLLHIKHWNGSQWVEGATPEEIAELNKPKVPEVVSRRQFKIALAVLGYNENDILNGIEQLSEPNKTIARISFLGCTHKYDIH